MLRDTYIDTDYQPEPATLPDGTEQIAPDHIQATVARLLTSASGYLERDRVAAKRCLDRAAELLEALRPSRNRDAGQSPMQPIRGGLAPWQINRLKTHVDANLASAIALESMAQICKLSASHFARAFKTSFGEPPHSYIVHQRIARARQIMLSTDEPLSQIAFACGFADQSHFSRLFRRMEGVSPNVWRRTNATAPDDGTAPKAA